MTQRSTGFALFAGFVALVAACGGSALEDGNPGAAGQPNNGGSSSSAGAPAAGGQSQAGGSAAGGPTGGASAAGAPAADRCSQPATPGMCDAYFPAFFHDPKTGLCEPFVYGGCGGNDNRFDTRAACLAACPGGGANWGACKVDSECALVGAGCCDACDPVQDHDLLALDAAHVSDQTNAHCANVGACAPCPAVSDAVATRKYFRPVCVDGQCSALDVRNSTYTECKAPTDCVLRDGVRCCAECDGGFVAVDSQSNFCPDGPQACPKCASTPPKEQLAICQAGRCVSSYLIE